MSQKWVVLLVNWRWWWFIFVGFKKKEKLASIRRKDIRTKHSNYSRLLILWVFRSCLPPPTFYPSHNIGFLLQKSNKEVVPPLKEKNIRQEICQLEFIEPQLWKWMSNLEIMAEVTPHGPYCWNVHFAKDSRALLWHSRLSKWALLKQASFHFITSDLWRRV